MARFTGGWIKTPRTFFDDDPQSNPLYGDPVSIALYMVLRGWAARKPTALVNRGQVLTSYGQLGRFLGCTKSGTRWAVDKLVSLGIIKKSGTRRGTSSGTRGLIITCLDYDIFEGAEETQQHDAQHDARQDNDTTTTRQRHDARQDNDTVLENARRGEGEKGRRGEDEKNLSGGVAPAGESLPNSPATDPKPAGPTPKKRGVQTDGAKVWTAYEAAYETAYGQKPVCNARQRALCSQAVARLGGARAEAVAAFFVTHRDAFYVRAMHPLSLLVRDCEKLATELQAGRTMTGHMANALDRESNNHQVVDFTLRMLAREKEEKRKASLKAEEVF